MKRLSRSIWVLAWGVWAWLGVGLYRELPRSPGPVLSRIVLKNGGHVLGFVGDTNNIVALNRAMSEPTEIETYEAETGELLTRVAGANYSDYLWPNIYSRRHGHLLAKAASIDNDDERASGLHRLDLTTGKWSRLTTNRVRSGACHETRPWAVVVEDERIIVVDWKAKKEVAVRGLGRLASINGRVFFFSGTDRIVIPFGTQNRDGPPPAETTIEVWKFGEKPVLEKTLADVPVFLFPSIAHDGRIAFTFPHGDTSIDVYDVDAERYLISSPPRDQRPKVAPGNAGWPFPPVLSASGRRVLGGNPSTLYDVDTGKSVWRGEGLVFADSAENVIFGFEDWERYWKNWLPSLKYHTRVIRDMEDNSVILRTSLAAPLQPRYWNAGRTLTAASNGAVYAFPFPVNWPLLALCQTILASPLVLVWAALRWRRRRRLRLASGA